MPPIPLIVCSASTVVMGVSKIRGPFFGVTIVRLQISWGLYWGPPFSGKLSSSFAVDDRLRSAPSRGHESDHDAKSSQAGVCFERAPWLQG